METISRQIIRTFFTWIPLAIVTTIMSGLVYATVQQSLRQGANDPQIQMADDVRYYLAGGTDPGKLLQSNKVDLAVNSSPFIMIFDDSGKNIAAQAQLDGKTPEVPKGVFDYARKNGDEKFTWQ